MRQERCALAAAGVLAAAAMTATAAPQQQQVPPTFRSGITMRAIEVRVVDQRGRPITGLRREDFTIEENGRPQPIRLFAPIELTPEPPAPGGAALVRAGTRPADLQPSTRRVFLIVLGRGELQVPAKGVDGMIRLVRNLLPQDVVAVIAWNRATDFTTDHERIARMLERYRDGHRQVEALLAQHFSGLAAIYGDRDIPDWMAKEIDAVLYGSDGPPARLLAAFDEPTGAVDAQIRRDTDLLLGTPSLDPFRALEAEAIGVSLDEYVSNSVQTMQDLSRIYAGLAFLRYLDGDKHLVYVSPAGLRLPSTDDDRSLARAAQDARVAIDVFHSSGMSARMWDIASSQNIAEFTGGQFTGVRYGEEFANTIDTATRTGYQLGYVPPNPPLDGSYRRVTVKVRRRGARVLHQRGYYAREAFTTFSRRQIIGQTRVEAVLRYAEPVDDLQLTVEAHRGKAADGRRQITVQVNVAPDGLAVTGDGANRSASLDVAVFCFDRQFLVGYVWRRVDLGLPDERYASFQKNGVGFTVHVPIRRSANMVKAVVYDYNADRIGTSVPKIK